MDTTQLHASWSSSDPQFPIKKYRYRIRKDSITGSVVTPWTSTGLATQVTATNFHCGMVSGLCNGVTYFFEVGARNSANVWSASGFSNGIRVDTTPPAAVTVTDDGAATTNATQLHATWTPSSDAESGILKYKYSVRQGSAAGTVVKSGATTATGVTVTGLSLQTNVTYYFKVFAMNGAKLKSAPTYSDGILVVPPGSDTTPPSAPGQPSEDGPPGSDHDASPTGNYVVFWNFASDPQSGISTYEIQEANAPAGPWTSLQTFSCSGAFCSYAVSGRLNGQTYYYRVRARNGSEVPGPFSVVSDGITVDTQPPQIGPIGVTNITASTADVNWSTNEPAICHASMLTGQTIPPNSTPQTLFNGTFTNLAEFTDQSFTVSCQDVAGHSVTSPSQAFRTTADAPLGANPFDVEGVIFASWWQDDYGTPSAKQSLLRLAKTGADYVGVLGTWYMTTTSGEASTSNTIFAHAQKTPSDTALIKAVRTAKTLDRRVFLKLHVRVILNDAPFGNWQDAWAGKVQPSNPTAWFTSYRNFAVHYAQIAQAEGVELLAFGTEMPSMTVPAYATQWNQVIDAIKAVYTGKLTFSSNQPTEFQQITFWNRCDYLGIGPYYSLTDSTPPSPSLDAIVGGWRNSLEGGDLIQLFSQVSAQYGNKPVLFTELGYNSVDTATFEPWKGTQSLPENQALQKRAYDALFLTLQKQPWFAGVFWWDWLTNPNAGTQGLDRRDYTPQNKPAEQSLKNFYLGLSASQVASIKIVDTDGIELPSGTLLFIDGHKTLYAQAKNSVGTVLGYAPATWLLNGSAASMQATDVGSTRLQGLSGGSVTVSASYNGLTDDVSLSVVEDSLRVPSIYPTIQAAADAAQSGDTIMVAPGTYAESVTLPAGVKLISDGGAAVTTIDATGKTFGVRGGQRVEGFTIRNATGAGIARGANSFANTTKEILHNIIRNNRPGIDLYAGGSVLIANNLLLNNIHGELGGGIRLDGGSQAQVINNVFDGNRSTNSFPQGGGIYISGSPAVIVRNNIFYRNVANLGSAVRVNGTAPIVEYNDGWKNVGSSEYLGVPPGPGAINVDPQFVNEGALDYHLQPASQCRNAGSDGTDMGLYGGPTPYP